MLKTLDFSRVFDFGSLLGEHLGSTSHFRTIDTLSTSTIYCKRELKSVKIIIVPTIIGKIIVAKFKIIPIPFF